MEFLTDERILLPLLATLGASLAVIGFQSIARYRSEKRQRVYAVNYMLDVAYRVLTSELIVKVHTILPHIEATKRIMNGDSELLGKTLLTDEFDILKAKSMNFEHLPNEFKVLIGYDDIEIVQMFDTFLYLYYTDENRYHLNEFVKGNLKSMSGFLSKTAEEQNDILNIYWDILNSLDHESNRILVFVRDTLLPKLNQYINGFGFLFFRKSVANKRLSSIVLVIKEYEEYFPKPDYMEKVRHGGIQSAL